MPIYEYYCSDCHTVFNFLSRRVQPRKKPACPKCGRKKLDRKLSRFAVSLGREEGDTDPQEPFPGLDETKMEKLMTEFAGDLDSLDEENPRQAAELMKRMYEATGMELGPAMKEAMARMEAGEDPEAIEQELGDALEAEDPVASPGGRGGKVRSMAHRLLPPRVDENLYEL